ncbi:MAG: DUF523 domain-containing protein [Bacillota bacterium]|nr:DUF523 domain-containing protein [Bacillota bacterium]
MNKKEPLLISACFLGTRCRYDGNSNELDVLFLLRAKYELYPICPEVQGGLTTPREPCEEKDDRIISRSGVDRTLEYEDGARKALAIVKKYGIKKALLKGKSPSCGSGEIYDGTFTRTLIKGDGVTVRLLIKEGLTIYSENEIVKLL